MSELQTAAQINAPQIGESIFTTSGSPAASPLKFDPKKVPMPAAAKHPLRASIDGDEEKIPELKTIIADMDLHHGLKSYLADKLDKLTSNAAAVHLKDVDRPDGGFDLHISVIPKIHGRRKMVQGVAVAADKPPVAPDGAPAAS